MVARVCCLEEPDRVLRRTLAYHTDYGYVVCAHFFDDQSDLIQFSTISVRYKDGLRRASLCTLMPTAAVPLLTRGFRKHIYEPVARHQLDRDRADRLQDVVCSPITGGAAVLHYG